MPHSLPNLLQRRYTIQNDHMVYRFGNGLVIKTDLFSRPDPQRVLGLGSPQGALMNHLLNFPDLVQRKEVFEPFAGSGALGLMSLKVGARHVDFLDINPRAVAFQHENAALNQFSPDVYRAITGDIATFTPDRRYDLILANPPFVPTPDGIGGIMTSNGGPEGNRFVALLLERLDDLLNQFVTRRQVEVTPAQRRPISFAVFCATYAEVFPMATEAITRWQAELSARYGDELSLNHSVIHVGPQGTEKTSYVIRENFAEKYGADLQVPFRDDKELAYARILENVLVMENQ